MDEKPEVDVAAATELLRRFCTAIFDSGSVMSAMRMMTPEARKEWANDWVVGELEGDPRHSLKWSEREAITGALASMDKDHRAWRLFADDTLRTWVEYWGALRRALDARDPTVLTVRRHRTMEELHALGGQWSVAAGRDPKRTDPVEVFADIARIDGELLVADIVIDETTR